MIRVSSPLFVLLLVALFNHVVKANPGDLVRKRREWIVPPKTLEENVDYTQEVSVAKIRSDYESSHSIDYSLEGIGANQDPFNVFVVDRKTGLIRVTQKLDRESIHMYNLSGVATHTDGRGHAEKKIEIRIKVKDQNDNAPVFGVIKPGEVYELSGKGTLVMKITATDADEPGNENSQMAYTIVDQNPSHDMFSISNDGTITVNKHSLDREAADQYILTVQAQDLNGQKGGNSATSTVTINVRDVNDNLPTLEREEYEGSIEENTQGVEVMRIKAEDLDVKNTENWEAVYDIVKGNEAGYFSIKTDPITNEGILMLDKAVDYEDVKALDLGLSVRNKAPLFDGSGASSGGSIGIGGGSSGAGGGSGGGGGGGSGGGGGGGGASGASGASGAVSWSGGSSWQGGTQSKSYPIKINVKNQIEGPGFEPKTKAIPISEGGNFNMKDVIAHYPATDKDTRKEAKNVRYVKGWDPDNWLTIDPDTAEIRLNKMPDRESPYLVNGTYEAKVLCISEDMPGKTATGTVAIQVEDFNDQCPTLTSNSQTMCTTEDSVIVNAVDKDLFPYGPPFDFTIVPEGTSGKWQVEHLNDTAAILRAQETMWPGFYEVEFLVKDQQGEFCPEPQKVQVQVCTCEDGVVCGNRGTSKGTELGPAAIGLLLLGLLLLLLIPLLLLFCHCGSGGLPGGFTEMPFDTKSHLINYRTEGQGENTEVPLLSIPTQVAVGTANSVSGMAPMPGFTITDGISGHFREEWYMNQGARRELGAKESGVGGGIYDGMALPDHFLKEYYAQKVMSGNENLGLKDGLLVYDYEGQGSSAGSVGCCSLLESDNGLQFLDDLGPKFKTLAEVCGGKKITTEVKQMFPPLPSASISTQSSVSSSMITKPQPPSPKLQPTVQETGQTVVSDTSERSQIVKEGTATVREGITTVEKGMANQGQMLLLQQQQPVYYTTTPMMQPMQYLVQPQVQNTMLVAEAPSTNLQGMVLVNSAHTGPAQGMVIQGQTVMSSGHAQGPGMVLVERSGVTSGGSNLIHTGNPSGSQAMMVVEGKVPSGSMRVLNGSQTCLMQGGTLQSGGLSGSQRVLVVGGSASSGGQLLQQTEGLSQKSEVFGAQRVLYSKGSTASGSQSRVVGSSTTTVNTTPSYRKVVVQETREIH